MFIYHEQISKKIQVSTHFNLIALSHSSPQSVAVKHLCCWFNNINETGATITDYNETRATTTNNDESETVKIKNTNQSRVITVNFLLLIPFFHGGISKHKNASGTNFPFIIYILPPHKFSTRPVVFEMEIEFERWPERHPAFTWIWTGLELDNYHYPGKLYFTYVRRGMFWQTWNKIIWL